MKGHTGNIYATISDRKLQIAGTSGNHGGYLADIAFKADYYPFGMIEPGRSVNPTDSRFAFQSMETDAEISGTGNSYTTYYRQYDPRIGRWKTPDPVIHAWESPYAGFANNAILYVDPRGDAVLACGVGLVLLKLGTVLAATGAYGVGVGTGQAVVQANNAQTNNATNLQDGGGDPKKNPNVIESGQVTPPKGATVEFTKGDITKQIYELPVAEITPEILSNKMGYGNALYPLAALGASFGNNLIEGPWYGNFVGPGPDGPNANPYMLPDPNDKEKYLIPIDLIDKAAQEHDDYYWKHGLSGVESALFSLEALPADIELVNAALRIMNQYTRREIDPYTGKEVSFQTAAMATTVYITFSKIVMEKITAKTLLKQ